jgi:hypothetical protein
MSGEEGFLLAHGSEVSARGLVALLHLGCGEESIVAGSKGMERQQGAGRTCTHQTDAPGDLLLPNKPHHQSKFESTNGLIH